MKRAVVLVGVGAVLGAAVIVSPLVHGRPPRVEEAPPAAVAATAPVEVPVPVPTTYDPMRSFAPLFDAVSPAVLVIEIEGRSSPSAELQQIPPEFRRFLDPRGFEPMPSHGEGSGFVVSSDGLVLTNHHVVANADTITARFADGHTVPAKVLGSDAHLDLALLRLEGDGPWPFVELGTSSDVKVGDWVVAVGNPLGLGTTMTAGIVSGKGRVIGHDVFDDFLQTDAAINPGNSGGPLFSLDGKVVGINTAIVNGANTVGFAVPSDLVRRAVDDLEDKGYVSRGFIGVRPVPEPGGGARVAEVFDGSPAKDAGLEAGDVITKVDGAEVKDPAALVRTIGSESPGEKVVLEVRRGKETLSVPVALGERPLDDSAVPGDATKLGVRLGDLDDKEARRLGIQFGVPVTEVLPGSPADGHLRAGDVIVTVNTWPVATAAQVAELVARSKGNALLEVLRDGKKVVLNVAL